MYQNSNLLYLNLVTKNFFLSFQLRVWYIKIAAKPISIGHIGSRCLERNKNAVRRLRKRKV